MARAVSTSLLPFSSFSTICNGNKLRPNSLRVAASMEGSAPLLRAAKYTVDKYIKSGMVIGLGSGHASGMAIQYLGQQLRVGDVENIVGIATSIASANEAAKVGIPLDTFTESSQIDFAFDDADILEEETLVAVVGRGSKVEDSIILQKNILTAAKKLVFMVTEDKYKRDPDGSVPVLVQCLKWLETAEEIEDLFLGDAEVWRRASIGHADPRGGDYPLITKEGHNVLDLIFTSPIPSLDEVAESLDSIRGVVDHGIISKLPCTAVVASESEVRVVENMVNSAVTQPAIW